MASTALILSKKIPGNGMSSSEEEELFQRNLKKSKNTDACSPNNEWPKLGEGGKKPWESGPSFAEKLQGLNRNEKVDAACANENIFSDDPLSESDHIESDQEDNEPLCVISEDPNRNFPTFTFSDRMKKRLYKAWNRAVIVKLLGREIGYKLLLSILQPLWAKRGVINLINIGNGFFVVKFTNNDDYRNALTGGPWMIFDHYLTVRPWEPMFHPLRAKINKVAVWLSNFDVWKVVTKPRRQRRGGKDKASTDSQRSNGGSRFEVLRKDGDDVASNKVDPPSAVLPGGTFKANRSFAVEVVEKRGNGLKKNGKGKSKYGGASVGNSGRSEKRTREGGNLLTVGPEGVGILEPAEVKKGNSDSFHIEPGKGAQIEKLQGKFWSPSRALDPDDAWEEEAQINCDVGDPSMGPPSAEETKCESEEPLKKLSRLGFDGLAMVPSIGRSGGIVAAWKSNQVGVVVLKCNRQFIHLRSVGSNNRPLLITEVYAIPDAHHKGILWEELRQFASTISEPWIVIGDFNDVAVSSERVGGLGGNATRMSLFADRIDQCQLVDIGAVAR
ncbi:hypothetical protein K1719_043914 [Acacia pycnantha]|nr:hypothetical protein K1719_043914 [Acacia pycnantha]